MQKTSPFKIHLSIVLCWKLMKQVLRGELLFKGGLVIANTRFPIKSFKGVDKACWCCKSGANEQLLDHSTDIPLGEAVERQH